MTKEAAIFDFFNSFGIPGYEENTVPSDASFPYITYQTPDDNFSEYSTSGSCSLWYRGESWVDINRKKDELSQKIGRGGVKLRCNGGFIWLKRGSPFAQNMGDESDNLIKRKLINLTIDYFTNE